MSAKTPSDLLALLNTRKSAGFPVWDELPAFELYMDQVVTLVDGYLAWDKPADTDDRLLTPAMVNNYVKQGLLPPPAKKRYGRVHLAYLLMLCSLKQTLDMATIGRILPLPRTEDDAKALYARFVQSREKAFDKTDAYIRASGTSDDDDLLLQLAVSASLCKNLASAIAPPPDKKAKKEKKEHIDSKKGE